MKERLIYFTLKSKFSNFNGLNYKEGIRTIINSKPKKENYTNKISLILNELVKPLSKDVIFFTMYSNILIFKEFCND